MSEIHTRKIDGWQVGVGKGGVIHMQKVFPLYQRNQHKLTLLVYSKMIEPFKIQFKLNSSE